MITNLEIRDDDTAEAFGQKFDVGRVLDAMIAFLKAFTGDVVAADRSIVPTIRFSGDRDRTAPLDGDGYARLRRETLAHARTHDVAADCARVDAGPFALRVYALGRDDLQRYGRDGVPMTIGEADWRDLDPTPVIDLTPSRGMPIFSERASELVRELVLTHAPEGSKPDFSRIPSLRFPHAAFGAGLGTLRISLLTVPVEP